MVCGTENRENTRRRQRQMTKIGTVLIGENVYVSDARGRRRWWFDGAHKYYYYFIVMYYRTHALVAHTWETRTTAMCIEHRSPDDCLTTQPGRIRGVVVVCARRRRRRRRQRQRARRLRRRPLRRRHSASVPFTATAPTVMYHRTSCFYTKV